MSVYHKWRTVFVQIPKNASTSIHSTLSNQTDEAHDHELYIEVISANDPELIESYFSFAVIRNPYDRFVSCYEYFRDPMHDWRWNLSFEELVDAFYQRGKYFYTTEDRHWWPQSRFIAIKKIPLVDKIIKYENLEDEWPEIINEISKQTPSNFSLPMSILPKNNVTFVRNNKNWEDYYTPELKEKVYWLYEKDFELFGYSK
jgi:hypothetical protein